jgi:hypothetical protein
MTGPRSQIGPSSRRPPQRFTPPPPPGAGSAQGKPDIDLPPLPSLTFGAPPGRAPGTRRPPPAQGGIRGVGVPPEIRRRVPGAIKAAPGTPQVVDRIRDTLGKAQRTLLASQRKLEQSVAALRSQLSSRQ